MKEAVEIQESPELSAEAVALMERVIWGTEGARYTLTGIEPTLRHLPASTYLTLRNDERLIGLRLFIEKLARWDGTLLQCFYHSMFCIDPAQKGKGYGKQLAKATLDTLGRRLGPKGLIYCHVEEDNLNSLAIAESLGYQRAGRFSAMTFSRLFPKPSSRLARLAPHQEKQVIKHLEEQYISHALTDFSLSLRADGYFLLVERDRILAGLQADPQRWAIHSLAGAGGALALHALPKIPLLRDLFNPQNFQFLKVGNIFFEPDHPEAVFELLEAVLARHALKTAMMFWDKESPVFRQIAAAGRFGILNALTETPVRVMALFQGFSPEEISDFCRRPKVISPCDI